MGVLYIPRQANPAAWLLSRRSVRRFINGPVPAGIIQQLLEAATQAPSAHNRQPARFAVIQDPAVKLRLAEAMGGDYLQDMLRDGTPPAEAEAQVSRSQQRLLQAPASIILSLDMECLDTYPDPKRQQAEYLMAVQGTAMAGENLLLAAHLAGLGAVWMCAPLFAPQAVRKTLQLPAGWEPQGLILLGYPAKSPEARLRRPVSEVARFY
jgi:F420 biosynthesis protein FbiB-like protein